MPATFVFLLKVNIALLLFCAGYYLVLRPLTFYTLNRIYLLATILFASTYPQINFSAFVQRHEELAKPMEQIAFNWQPPAQLVSQPVQTFDYWYWLSVIFWTGAGLLFIRLAMQLFSLLRLYKNSKPQYIGEHLVRIMDKDAAPFSFWRSIYVNPAKHEPADLKSILLHEQVHVNQWHTADILLAELSSIFYWFNPGIWLIKRAVRENIEFITDRKILKNGIDSKTYQYSLVNVSFNSSQPSIVNHFNISTIKKRIIMMNAKRSSKLNLTRYAFVVPAVMALLLVFSISKADFAKPVRITLAAAVQPLARIININPDEVASPAAKATKAPKPAKKVKTLKPLAALAPVVAPQAALSPLAANPVTLQPNNTDTTKNSKLIINGKKVVFMINGVVSPTTSFENYPTNVERTTLLSGELAKKLAKSDDDKPILVAYIVTKDAKNKEELENATREDDDNAGFIIGPDNKVMKLKVPKAFVVKSTTSTSSSTSSSGGTVTVKGMKAEQDTFTKPWTIAYERTGRVSPDKAIKINGLTIASNGDKDPLVIVDGKTSTIDSVDSDMIETVLVMKSDDVIKKYGKKAKNGVIMITTKKK